MPIDREKKNQSISLDTKRLLYKTYAAILEKYIDGNLVTSTEIDAETRAIFNEFLKDHPRLKPFEHEVYGYIKTAIQNVIPELEKCDKVGLTNLYNKLTLFLNTFQTTRIR